MNNISIKGNKNGLVVSVTPNFTYEDLKKELILKIENAKDFFYGCNMTIIDDTLKWSSNHYDELITMLKSSFNITLNYSTAEADIENKSKIFSGITEGRTKFIKKTVRSGQKLYYNGNIVIIGDVNSGSEVIATGNIIVLGVLRGQAHAGADGNSKAFIAAYIMQPTLLIISDIIARSPDEKLDKPTAPEIAFLKNGNIEVEPYLLNKFI